MNQWVFHAKCGDHRCILTPGTFILAVLEAELKPIALVLASYTASDWENGSTGIVKRITWDEIKGFTQESARPCIFRRVVTTETTRNRPPLLTAESEEEMMIVSE